MGQVIKAINNAVNPFYKDGGKGKDNFTIHGLGAAYGRGGDDTLKAYALYVHLSGGEGDDHLESYSGVSDLYGGSGNDTILAKGGANFIHTGTGKDTVEAYGGANIINATEDNLGDEITAYGGANIINAGGGGDRITVGGIGNFINAGDGDNEVEAYGGVTVVNSGEGKDRITLGSGLNTLTKVGDGDSVVGMAGGLNVATLVGDGQFYGGFLGLGNIMTKVGTGDTYIAATGVGNVLTHIDDSEQESDTAALLLGGGNVLTKAGNGDLLGLMAGGLNVATHVGDGDLAIAQLGGGNLLTKVGNGNSIAVQFGLGNVNTHIGDGTSLAVMAGSGNVFTKVGDGLTAAGMVGSTNIYTHVGSGDSLALMVGGGNVFTKVEANDSNPDDMTAAALLGGGNLFTHVGDGITAALMVSAGNIFTKVGDGTTLAAMGGQGNIATHIGDGSTFAAMVGVPMLGVAGNVLTKVGNGTTAALMAANGNVFTHIGDGNTLGLTAGQANIVTKVGQGEQINLAFGQGNVLTHVSTVGNNNDSYNLAVGDANIVTKVGNGEQVSLLSGKANVVTHVGEGDSLNFAVGGQANLFTKVGDGNTISGIINSKLNILTHVGDGDNLQGVWGQGNIVTQVGNGASLSALKGDINVMTVVGDGAQVGMLWGQGNFVTKVGDGTSVNVFKGTGNVNTKVGNGTSITLVKGNTNVNLRVGDGDTVVAAYGKRNISVNIGDGDYYGLTIAPGKSTVKQSLKEVGSNLLETAKGFIASDIISQLIWGPEDTGDTVAEETEGLEVAAVSETLALPIDATTVAKRTEVDDSKGFTLDAEVIAISEPEPTSTLAEDNPDSLQELTGKHQETEMVASGTVAQQKGRELQQGVDEVKGGVNWLLAESEQVLGDGGMISGFLDETTDTLINQLSVLNGYIDEGDELLFGGGTSDNDRFQGNLAEGIIGRVNEDVAKTVEGVNEQLDEAQQQVLAAEIHIAKGKLDATQREDTADESELEAVSEAAAAQQRGLMAQVEVYEAKTGANSEVLAAKAQASRLEKDAKGETLSKGDKPSRTAGTGSGLDKDTVRKGVVLDTSFGDGEIDGLQATVLTSQQQQLLGDGLGEIKVQFNGMPNPLLQEEIEEEEEEELGEYRRIRIVHSWQDSNEVDKWVNGSHKLGDNVRGWFDKKSNFNLRQIPEGNFENFKEHYNFREANFKQYCNRIIETGLMQSVYDWDNLSRKEKQEKIDKYRTDNLQSLTDNYYQEQYIHHYFSDDASGNTIPQLLHKYGLNSDYIYQTYNHDLTPEQNLANFIKLSLETITPQIVQETSTELTKDPDFIPSQQTADLFTLFSEYYRFNNEKRNETYKNVVDQKFEEDYKDSVKHLIGQKNLLKWVFDQSDLAETIIEKARSKQSIDLNNLCARYENKMISELKNITTQSWDTTYYQLDQLYKKENQSSYLNLTYNSGAGGGIKVNQLFDTLINDNNLKFFMDNTSRENSRKAVAQKLLDYNDDFAEVARIATLARGLDIPISRSENHILSDSCLKLILADLESKRNGVVSDAEALNTAIKQFVDSLVGVNEIEMRKKLGEANIQNNDINYDELARQYTFEGFQAFRNSITSNISDDDLKKEFVGYDALNKLATAAKNAIREGRIFDAYNLLSYAPGNIRYGDKSINGTKSNFFDAPLEVVVTNTNEQDKYKIKYCTSAERIANSIAQLSSNGLLNSEIAQYSTLPDFSPGKTTNSQKGFIYSSSPLLFVQYDYDEQQNRQKTILSQDEMRGLYGVNEKIGFRGKITENFDSAMDLIESEDSTKYVSSSKFQEPVENAALFARNIRSDPSDIDTESSGIEKSLKRIDYVDITPTSTNEAGDKLTVYKIMGADGKPAYRVQIDIEGDESKRISVFSSENPIQADGSLRLPETTTLVTHGEKIPGDTYTSPVENKYLGEDDKYLNIGANDFRNVENLEIAEHQTANSEKPNYLLTKYRGEDEGLGVDMSKNQEQVILTTLKDRDSNGKANMGYMTVSKHSSVTSQQVEAALNRSGTKSLINGHCRAPKGTPESQTDQVKVQEEAKPFHNDGKETFAKDIKQAIADTASLRQTDMNGHRQVGVDKLVKQANSIGGKLKRKAFQVAPKTTLAAIKLDQSEIASGNLQIQVGDGEFTTAFWGNTNIGIKVGDGGFKGAVYGDNNIFVHVGDGDNAKHTQTLGKYNAFEGLQLFMGQRNLSFNYGDSNDLILMHDQSVPLPPFQSPFAGPTDIINYLETEIAQFSLDGQETDPFSGEPIEDNYYDSQNYLWSLDNIKPIIDQLSSLDQNSSVEYETLYDYGSQSDRNIRALQADVERAANKGFNRMTAGGSPFERSQTTPIKDQNFNITIAGQGADILLANGDYQFMFGDNLASFLDTTIASLFGMAAQERNAENGQVGNTMSYSPENSLNQLIEQFVSRISASLPDLTLGEVLGLGYDAQGNLIKQVSNRLTPEDIKQVVDAFSQFVAQQYQKSGYELDDVETGDSFDITQPRHLLTLFQTIAAQNLGLLGNPEQLIDNLKTALDLGGDAIQTFTERLLDLTGIETPEATDNAETPPIPATEEPIEEETPPTESSKVFGFGGLTLPSIFDIDPSAIFTGKTDIINDMVGLVNSFEGDIDNMQQQMFDFFANSGYMQQDGDILISLGNDNYSWGGHGNDLTGLMGLNNNFWGGSGDDLYYGMGENNQGSGNEGNDTAVLIGINNLFFGGPGHDFGLAVGRFGNLSGGDDDDTLYILGSNSWLGGDGGNDYLVAVGNYNAIQSGAGNDYTVYVGNYGDIQLDAGEDVFSLFGNKNTVHTGDDGDYIRIMGHQSDIYAGAGNDFIWTDAQAQGNSIIQGGDGDDIFVLGGLDNVYYGGAGEDSFIISDLMDNVTIEDISAGDRLLFANVSDSQLWFEREQDDLLIYLEIAETLENEELNNVQSNEDELLNDEQQPTGGEFDELTGPEQTYSASQLTLPDYFNEQQADLVINSDAITENGDPAYETLAQNALDEILQIMSEYDVIGSGEGFLTHVTPEDQQKLALAWNETSLELGSVMVGYDG